MIRKIIVWIVLGALPLLLVHWDERHGHHVPKWLLLLSAVPLAIAVWRSDDDYQLPGPARNVVLFVMGLFGIFIGIVGFVLRDAPALYGLGHLFVWMMPVGGVMALTAVIRG